MLSITLTIFALLAAGSFATIGFYKTTINGIVTSQKNETAKCQSEIQSFLNNNFQGYYSILENYFHCIALKVDKAKFLGTKLQNLITGFSLNIIFIIAFYYVCLVASTKLSTPLDDIINIYFALPIVCISAWGLLISYGFYMIYKVDDLEELEKLSLRKYYKKLKAKL